MENLNLLGVQVQNMNEAIELLKCTKETLIFSENEVLINGITFYIFTYMTENNTNYYYSVTASNLQSNQYN